MPELPEVETICRDLRGQITNKRITNVEVIKESAVKNNAEYFVNNTTGKAFSGLGRRAKMLIFNLGNSDYYILSHLRMTGKFIYDYENKTEYPTDHTGVIITFSDDSKLYFDDIRTFGYMHLVDVETKNKTLSKFGIEPLTKTFTFENFKQIFKNRRTNIKNLLLNQQAIAGIGNIYADEICFESEIDPQRKVPDLNQKELKRIYEKIEVVLQKAINHRGTTFSDYEDISGKGGNFKKKLKVYQREGKPCYSCKKEINKIKLNGRGTYFCNNCQQ